MCVCVECYKKYLVIIMHMLHVVNVNITQKLHTTRSIQDTLHIVPALQHFMIYATRLAVSIELGQKLVSLPTMCKVVACTGSH